MPSCRRLDKHRVCQYRRQGNRLLPNLVVTIRLTPEIHHFCVEKWSFTLVKSNFSP